MGVYEDNVDISDVPWNFCLRLYAQIYQNGLHIAYVHFDSENTLSKRLLRHGIYLLLAFLICYRGWFGNGLILGGGDQPDWTGTAWAYWWTGHAITNGINPFDGQWNFYPIGQRPLAQYNLLDALLAWPLIQFFGVRVGYNLFCHIGYL